MAIQAAAQAEPTTDRNPFAGAGYRWWWGTTLASSVAVGLQLVTVPAYVLDRTDTRFYVALALLCQTVPTALLTLLGGAVADRSGRRRILLTSLGLAAVASGAYVALAVGGVRAIWPIFPIAAVVGATAAFQAPARQAMVRGLAPGSRLQNAVILGTFAFMGGAQFLGPALAGVTVRAFGLTEAFVLEVVLLAIAWYCALRLPAKEEVPPGPVVGLGEQVKQGLHYVRSDARIWQLMLLSIVPGLCFMGAAQAVFPVFARDTFGLGADAQGLLNGGMGLGVLVGSLLLLRWGPQRGRGRWIMASLPWSGLIFLLVGLSPSLALAAALLFFSGLGAAVFINFASTLLQTYTDPRMIGRVMSLWGLAFLAAVPLGNLQAGVGIQLSDPRVVLVYSGALAIVLGVVAFVSLRAARELE